MKKLIKYPAIMIFFFAFCSCKTGRNDTRDDAGEDADDGIDGDDGSGVEITDGEATGDDAGWDESEDEDAREEEPISVECDEHFFEDVMIPMRDGKSLSAFVRRPENPECVVPTILIQTPYNKENVRNLWLSDTDTSNGPLFQSMDYAIVAVDWRGFHGSAGAAVEGADYGEDGYDTVEWVAAQPWSDSKIGTWGVSAVGQQQYKTAANKPPHMTAAIPIFCNMNMKYEKFFPGGVPRRELFDFIGPYYGMTEFLEEHPYYDDIWNYVENVYKARDIGIPVLVVAGWQDHNGTERLRVFDDLRAHGDPAARDEHKLLIGDWHHFAVGCETAGMGREFTEQELEYVDVEHIVQEKSLAFFDYHLRGVDNEVAGWEFVHFIRAGESVWDSSGSWPIEPSAEMILYLEESGGLVPDAPAGGEIDFPYDPDDPSPTYGGQTIRFDLDHGPMNQSYVLVRDDAVLFESQPLNLPLRVQGAIRVDLAVRTTGVDTDFIIRLTDVDEEGEYLLIDEGARRLKLRDSLRYVSPVTAGERYDIEILLINHLAYTFAAGHKIGIIVSSSNFPRFDPNPNNGEDFYIDEESSITVTNTIITDGYSKIGIQVEP